MAFEPFQKVLVCNGLGDIWRKAFFDRMVESHYGFKYAAMDGNRYRYCIPFDISNDLSGQLVEEEPIEVTTKQRSTAA